ncbi:hypothetical protein HMPREF9140_00150, partial [Prevotella micans F0438]
PDCGVPGLRKPFYCRIAAFQGFESLFIAGLRRSGSSKAFLLPDCGVPGLRKPFYCRIAAFRGLESLFVAGLRRSEASKAFLLSDCDVPGLRKPFYCRIATFRGLESLFIAGLRRSEASKAFLLPDCDVPGLRMLFGFLICRFFISKWWLRRRCFAFAGWVTMGGRRTSCDLLYNTPTRWSRAFVRRWNRLGMSFRMRGRGTWFAIS